MAWDCRVQAPTESYFAHEDGTTTAIDQKDLPILRIARVYPRDVMPTPDIAGTVAFFNASPIGKWKFYINDLSTNREQRTAIDDLIAEVIVATKASG